LALIFQDALVCLSALFILEKNTERLVLGTPRQAEIPRVSSPPSNIKYFIVRTQKHATLSCRRGTKHGG